jgi:hypothetical protein
LCPLYLYPYSKPANHHPRLLQALWQLWVPPSSVSSNHASDFLQPVRKNINFCITQVSFHVVSCYAQVSVIAWLLKTSDLEFSPAPRELYAGRCYPLLDDFEVGS